MKKIMLRLFLAATAIWGGQTLTACAPPRAPVTESSTASSGGVQEAPSSPNERALLAQVNELREALAAQRRGATPPSADALPIAPQGPIFPAQGLGGMGPGSGYALRLPVNRVIGDVMFVDEPAPWDQDGGYVGRGVVTLALINLVDAVEVLVNHRRICPSMGGAFPANVTTAGRQICTVPPPRGFKTQLARFLVADSGSPQSIVVHRRTYNSYTGVVSEDPIGSYSFTVVPATDLTGIFPVHEENCR